MLRIQRAETSYLNILTLNNYVERSECRFSLIPRPRHRSKVKSLSMTPGHFGHPNIVINHRR